MPQRKTSDFWTMDSDSSLSDKGKMQLNAQLKGHTAIPFRKSGGDVKCIFSAGKKVKSHLTYRGCQARVLDKALERASKFSQFDLLHKKKVYVKKPKG